MFSEKEASVDFLCSLAQAELCLKMSFCELLQSSDYTCIVLWKAYNITIFKRLFLSAIAQKCVYLDVEIASYL